MALMASSEASDSGPESHLDPNDLFSNLTRSEVESCLTGILEKFQSLKNRHKDLKRIHVAESEALSELKKKNSNLKEIISILEKDNSALKSKSKELEKEIISEAPMEYDDVIKKYIMAFKTFLPRNIDRSKMDSMIYGVSINGKIDLGYVSPNHSRVKPKYKQKDTKLKSLYSYFIYGHTHDYFAEKPKVKKNSEKTNKKGSKKLWIPKDQIIYIVDILSNRVETTIMVSGLKMLMSHNRKKAYVPNSGN